MKILLINPPHIQKRGLYPKLIFQPIGLAYIAAVLEREKHNVSILDALGLGWNKVTELDSNRQLIGLTYEEIAGHIKNISPQIVGISVPFTIQAESAFSVASLVKKVDNKIITILGGAHITSHPLDCLTNPNVDFIVMGEGETPVVNLINALKTNSLKKLKEISSLGFKQKGALKINLRQPPFTDLDSLPFPARHLLPMDEYFKASQAMRTGRTDSPYKRAAVIISSRGCPFTCTFCLSHHLWGRFWRYRSPENITNEIQELVEKYCVNHIHFEDDNLTLDKERMGQLCDLIVDRKLKISWDTPNGIRGDTVDEEVLLKMKTSGCQELCVAPESGNQYVVDNVIKKRVNLKKIEETVKICKKIGIKVDAFFVIGSVGETKEQIQDTINFAKRLRKLGCRRCHFHIATPFEGTELYEQAKKMGYLVEAPKDCIQLETPRIQTSEFTVREIDQLFQEGIKVNPIIPTDKLYIALKLLITNPARFIKVSFRYLTKRQGGLSS